MAGQPAHAADKFAVQRQLDQLRGERAVKIPLFQIQRNALNVMTSEISGKNRLHGKALPYRFLYYTAVARAAQEGTCYTADTIVWCGVC